MPRKRKPQKRKFGAIRKFPSGRWQARYLDSMGKLRPAPATFETKEEAEAWLSQVEAERALGDFTDPHAGDVAFADYAAKWITERNVAPTTQELYRRLLRLHLAPFFGDRRLNEITPAMVRTWRTERLAALKEAMGGSAESDGATTVAKSYRLLKAVMETAVEDGLVRRNPCRIKGAGQEHADERPVATVDEVFELAEAIGIRWRLMVLLGAFASMRPEELAELRRKDIDLESGMIWVRRAAPELNDGKRAIGDPKSRAGRRKIVLPEFVHLDVSRHLEWFAEPGAEGLVFVGERGAPLRGTTFGRKYRKARDQVGLPGNFRFYDLRHTGNTLAADTGAKLKDLMVRAGHASERAQLIYQHSTERHQRRLASEMNTQVQEQRSAAEAKTATSGTATVLPLRPRSAPRPPSPPRGRRRGA